MSPVTVPGRRRAPFPGRDDGSLAIALLLVMVGVTLSVLLTPVLLGQFSVTRHADDRDRALQAARTGLDVALAHIRTAPDGDITRLPCGPFRGAVTGGAPADGSYAVTLDYLAADPHGRDAAWIAANRVACVPAGGTQRTPQYAVLRSRGTAASGLGRVLQATYRMRLSNANIAGGLIHVYRSEGDLDLCMDAGSGTPAAGSVLRMQPCSPGSERQKFAYNPNLTLTLVASRTDEQPLGMCLDADVPHAEGAVVRFEPCASTTRPRQQWSFNDSANFEGTTDGRSLDMYCFNLQNPNTPGSLLVLRLMGGCGISYSNVRTFTPENTVGAGAAGPAIGQLVNFDQFGHCIDVTDHNVNTPFLILWPCKQAPDASYVAWNQKWRLPDIAPGATQATGPIAAVNGGASYCLRSPGSTSPGYYVTLRACPAGAEPREMIWTVHGDTGDYTTGYRIVDGYGHCLSPTDPAANPPDLYPIGKGISKLVVAPCDGSTLQKWNAPPDILQAMPLTDISER
ncbi:RICIN domain-containing protein [Spirillospora sp. CA-253888]